MESYVLDWLNLLLRWAHVVTAIAWIGGSFYLEFLDRNLTPPADDHLRKQGISGELWAVHTGGLVQMVRFARKPPPLPQHLPWFRWESYSTWLSGFALFTVSYLWSSGTYLIDKSRMDWVPWQAITVAILFLVVFWLLYDAVCRKFGQRKNGDAIVVALVCVLVGVASWLACHWFAGRAAFLLVGAMLATSMSANVAHWIIPGQRKLVAAIKAGEPVDPIHGTRGKQRNMHNTYFTLPVLFAMLSGHYSFTYTHPQNWLVLMAMMCAGAAIRHFFVMRHGHKLGRNANPLSYAGVGVAVILALMVWLAPAPEPVQVTSDSIAVNAGSTGATGQIGYKTLQPILAQRCYMCHGVQVQMKNVRLDSVAQVKRHAQAVYQQVVVSKLMPMNNSTGISQAERMLIKTWFETGAKTD